MAKLAEDIDALFKLPLSEFIGARKTLAARLKKNGYADEANRVKALTKPSISAWTVNQLYWTEREAFDELIATGQRFRKAQASGKMVNMREALDARREALSHLTDLATELLRNGGHNPSLDIVRRTTTTLEAMSSFASASDGPTPGRLTQDIDPPGFDSFGSFTPSPSTSKRAPEPRRDTPSKISGTAVTKAQPSSTARQREERQQRINTAKASLKNARKSLSDAQAMVKSVEAARKRAEAAAKEAERQKRQAEERFQKATAASQAAAGRARTMGAELITATEALDETKRTVEKATRELEEAFRELPPR